MDRLIALHRYLAACVRFSRKTQRKRRFEQHPQRIWKWVWFETAYSSDIDTDSGGHLGRIGPYCVADGRPPNFVSNLTTKYSDRTEIRTVVADYGINEPIESIILTGVYVQLAVLHFFRSLIAFVDTVGVVQREYRGRKLPNCTAITPAYQCRSSASA